MWWTIVLCALMVYCIVGVIISADDSPFYTLIHSKWGRGKCQNIWLVIKLIILFPSFLVCGIVRGIEYIGVLIKIVKGK